MSDAIDKHIAKAFASLADGRTMKAMSLLAYARSAASALRSPLVERIGLPLLVVASVRKANERKAVPLVEAASPIVLFEDPQR